ncbi:hypothetical protein FKM82_021597 [Ascaphus truei]
MRDHIEDGGDLLQMPQGAPGDSIARPPSAAQPASPRHAAEVPPAKRRKVLSVFSVTSAGMTDVRYNNWPTYPTDQVGLLCWPSSVISGRSPIRPGNLVQQNWGAAYRVSVLFPRLPGYSVGPL